MKNCKKLTFLLLLLSSMLLTSCWQNKSEESEELQLDVNQIKAENLVVNDKGLSKLKATIKTIHGNIVFKFYPRKAPNTTTRVIKLIQKRFYDGLTFHRVIPNFVIQGGDPSGNGTGGSGTRVKAEFNSIQHIRGTVAMARAQDIDSADSQFYIALATLPHLDNNYTVFGQVLEGMDLLDKIVKGDKMLSVSVSN